MSKNSLLRIAISVLIVISILVGCSIKTAKGEIDSQGLNSSVNNFLL